MTPGGGDVSRDRGRSALSGAPEHVLRLDAVSVYRGDGRGARRFLLQDVDWVVDRGQHWAVLGRNGAGKTTLLQVASTQLLPSSGRVTILGGVRGRVHVDRLRPRIGVVERGVGDRFWPGYSVVEVVLTGVSGTIALLREHVSETNETEARRLLELAGVGQLADRPFVHCSEGERTRVLLARALMTKAALLVLDEPATGLDLPGREFFLAAAARVAHERPDLATLTATHHLEELPPTTSHALLLRDGAVVAAGPIGEVLTDELVSACFGLATRIERRDGRLFARASARRES